MKNVLTILLMFFFLFSNGQITYTRVPLDLQLVARDKVTNLGNVAISGIVDQSSNYNSVKVEVFRNNVLLNSENNTLMYINSRASFEFNISIQAELANYSFKIYGCNSTNTIFELNKTVANVVAGDVYIIQGQSNAVASKYSGSANSNKSDYIRVYSSGTMSSTTLLSNDNWYIADGDVSIESNGNIGQWGLKLARMLIEDLQIPIAIFNGANGGKPISYFQAPSNYETSQSSNYGRLYYRLNKTGLKNNVKAVLWSQGESNAGTNYISILDYKKYFIALKNSWLKDYPNMEKIYIFQTKDCTCSTTAEGKMNVKEAQRELAYELPDIISIMPTTSLYLSSGGCHFAFINGYESFATRIHKLVLHDIYGKSFIEEIKAPMIQNAEFIAPNTLVLETDAVALKFSSTDQTTMLHRLKQDFELRNVMNVSINDVALLGNKIIFTLSGDPGPIGNVSFVGYNSNIGYTITNSSDLELISFRNLSIKNSSYNGGDNSIYPKIENTAICNSIGSIANITVNPTNTNTSYTWLFKIPDGDFTPITSLNAGTIYTNYNSPSLEIKKSSTSPVSGTIYRVVENNSNLENFTSNEAILTFDSTPVSKLITGASAVCAGGSKTLTYGTGSVGDIQWQQSDTSSSIDFVDIEEETGEVFTATDILQTTWYRVKNTSGVCGSLYSPAVQVIVNPVPVSGNIDGGNVNVCKTSNSTVLTLNNSVGTIQWQKATTLTGTYSNISIATSTTYTASALTTTTYYRAVLSSGVCNLVYSPSVQIGVNVVPVFIQVDPICIGSQILPLPTTSINRVIGSWSPSINNIITTEYTFTPTIGVCSPTTKMTITVNSTKPPLGDSVQAFNTNILNSISDLLSIGSNLRWYASLENALADFSFLELNTPIVIGNTYYAMQTINGCSSTTPLVVKTSVNLGITDIDFKKLQFYPNPVEDYFTLIYPEIISEIQLFNNTGQSVFIAHPKASNPTININYLPVGTYYMEVKSKNKKGIVKVIKK